jgi:hypothetical protein
LSYVLSYDVEYSLSKVIERELELIRELELVLSDIRGRYDFSVADVFNLLDSYGLNYINAEG